VRVFSQFKGSLAGGVTQKAYVFGRPLTLIGYQSSIGAVLSTDPQDIFGSVLAPSTDDDNEGMLVFMNSGFFYQCKITIPDQKVYLTPDSSAGGAGYFQLVFEEVGS